MLTGALCALIVHKHGETYVCILCEYECGFGYNGSSSHCSFQKYRQWLVSEKKIRKKNAVASRKISDVSSKKLNIYSKCHGF